jgi:hypothetical protein
MNRYALTKDLHSKTSRLDFMISWFHGGAGETQYWETKGRSRMMVDSISQSLASGVQLMSHDTKHSATCIFFPGLGSRMALLSTPRVRLPQIQISELPAFREERRKSAPTLFGLSEATCCHAVRAGGSGFVKKHGAWFSRCYDSQRR